MSIKRMNSFEKQLVKDPHQSSSWWRMEIKMCKFHSSQGSCCCLCCHQNLNQLSRFATDKIISLHFHFHATNNGNQLFSFLANTHFLDQIKLISELCQANVNKIVSLLLLWHFYQIAVLGDHLAAHWETSARSANQDSAPSAF